MELQETPHISLFGDLPESPIPVSPRLDFHFSDFFNIRLVFLLQLNSASLVGYIPKRY
jgi:hypothetical protein